LIVDMEAVHWKKIQRVTPWLLPEGDPPAREYLVPHEAMVDVTQSMACIQCGACVSDCLSMEVDPAFIGPAALAKAYRFVGHPRAVPELISGLPTVARAMARRKMTPKSALLGPSFTDRKAIKHLVQKVEAKDRPLELNLYISGYEEEPVEKAAAEEERGPHR